MPILAVGLSHQRAPVKVRERLAISPARLDGALDRLLGYVPEGVILSTCNRVEIYALVAHRAAGLPQLTMFLSDENGLPLDELQPYLVSYWQQAAARHLFRVAAGLESQIVGEGQVLGQVGDAYRHAADRGRVGPVLGRLFDRALAVGKRARTETGIARRAVSVGRAAVELARQATSGLEAATLLVIGTGKMGTLAAQDVRGRGGRVILMNRTANRAEALARRLGCEAWALDRLPEALNEADVVITSTAAERFLLTLESVALVAEMRTRPELVVIDIAVPRNVDPGVGEIPGIRLFNVDDLREVSAVNLEHRRGEVRQVEAIVEQELDGFASWLQAREVVPTISALVQRAEAIRQHELARTLGHLGSLSDQDLKAIDAMSLAIVRKILHAPIVRLKDRIAAHDGEHYLHAVRELFDLSGSEAGAK